MRKVKAYLIDGFHIDIAEARADRGKPQLLVAIDCTSKPDIKATIDAGAPVWAHAFE